MDALRLTIIKNTFYTSELTPVPSTVSKLLLKDDVVLEIFLDKVLLATSCKY